MTDESLDKLMTFFLTAICVSFVWVIVSGARHFGTDESWRTQIVEHGCAEYYLDQAHDRQWRWK